LIEKRSKSEIYLYYKQLSIWKSLYSQHFETEKDNYSQFHLDLKDITNKNHSDVTKIDVKYESFYKVVSTASSRFVGCL